MKIKKIALITPPYHSGVVESAGTWLNLGFVYIAGALRRAGYEVDYHDAMSCWHTLDDIQQRIEDFQPDLVATTAFTASIVDAVELLALAKRLNPAIVTTVGNVHATFCYAELLQEHPHIDFVVRGEGELTLVKLIACLNAAAEPLKVPGLAFRLQAEIVVTPPAPFIQELDQLTPAWDLVDWSIYSYYPKQDSTLAIVSSSRGCSQNCSFCSQQLFWQRTWRARSPLNFVTELERLRDNHGVNVAMLADETPTLNQPRWEKILDLLIERQVGVKLLMETRVDDILRDEKIIDKYKLAGIEHIYVGVEAGTQKNLDIFKKGTKVEQSKKAIDLINQADIVSETSFVLGMPDETAESIASMVELAIHYNPDMAFFLAIAPWPYADLYPELKEHVATRDYRKYNLVEAVIKPRQMSLEQVNTALGQAAQRFFMTKFQNLGRLSAWKQEFMIAVFQILLNNSYLAGQMKAMSEAGHAKMPAAILKVMAQLKDHQSKSSTIAPIP